MRRIFIITAAIVTPVALTAYCTAIDLGAYAVTAPAAVAIDNRTYHNSQAYTDGNMQQLASYFEDYNETADAAHKQLILSLVRHEFASFDARKLAGNDTLATFLEKARDSQ